MLATAPDAVFDEVIRLIAKLFDVPIALVSLVDEGRVWFKANFGMAGVESVKRNESICSVAVLQDDTTVYEDLQTNPCQLTDPLAAEALRMRFYAGHPLHNKNGYNIGALCLIDRKPRSLSTPEQQRLRSLAAIVTKMLDLRLALYQHPEYASSIWLKIYNHLDVSLTRLDTLAELARWEDSPSSEAARDYQRSREDEATLVITILDQQVSSALALIH